MFPFQLQPHGPAFPRKDCLLRRLWLGLLLLWVVPSLVGAETRFSLLTASPGKAVWAHYGHSGIRYVDTDRQVDVVFNYGLFDFSAPHFLHRFITGQTDYEVGATDFYSFMLEYQLENRAVTEQVLNLSAAEKERLLNALLENLRPENKVYRYNFFFKNCATQPRDMIEAALDGTIQYTLEPESPTLRAVVHQHTEAYPWVQFGIDFALGAKADRPAGLRDQQFAPTVLMASFASALILADSAILASDTTLLPGTASGYRPLVASTTELSTVDPSLEHTGPWTPGPILVMWMVVGLTLLGGLLTYPFNKTATATKTTGFFMVWIGMVYGMAGVVGSLLYFLLLCSEHPTVDVNYLAIWLHPLHLFFALSLPFRAFRQKVAPYYLAANVPLQVFALAGTLFPQTLHPAAYPFLIALMLMGLRAVFALYKRQHHA